MILIVIKTDERMKKIEIFHLFLSGGNVMLVTMLTRGGREKTDDINIS